MLEGIGLFRGIMAKMDWLDQNQRVISQNVANADTPNFRPLTLKEKNFKAYMGASLEAARPQNAVRDVALAATDSDHFGAVRSGGSQLPGGNTAKQKEVYESSVDDNGVVLEEQLFKANANSTQYQIATDLYRRNVGMLRMVLQGSRG